MRRKTLRSMLTFIISFAMVVSFLPVNAFDNEEANAENAGNYVPFTETRPTIGDGAVWDSALVLELEQHTRRAHTHPAELPTATATAQLLWDYENLYVRIMVNDSTPFTAGDAHQVDGVEIFLNETNERRAMTGQNPVIQNQYRLARSGQYSSRWQTPTTAIIGYDSWRRVTQDNGVDGYNVFIAIPLLYDNGPVNGQEMLFDIMLNDANNQIAARTAEISWHDAAHAGFSNSNGWGEIILAGAPANNLPITATTGFGGSISPASVPSKVWVAPGANQTFTFTPANGYVVSQVLVNGVNNAAAVAAGTFEFTNVTTAENTIEVIFAPAPGALELPFYVFNDMFANGEFTTAVIIDLGAERTVNTADLNPEMFTVSANNRNAFGAQAPAFVGNRRIVRVYANNNPKPLGYLNPAPGSAYPGELPAPPASGSYIIIELEFWSPAGGLAHGGMTVSGSNTLELRYNIIANNALTISGTAMPQVRFAQATDRVRDNGTGIIAPVLDQFVGGQIPTPSEETTRTYLPYTIFINEEAEGPLPLFVYLHGGGRGPDLFSPLRTANGAAALAKPQWQAIHPSHVLSPQGNHYGTTQALNQHLIGDNQPHLVAHRRYLAEFIQQMIDDGLVDPNRVYMSGFSIGSRSTIAFMRDFPEMLAAIAPVASGHLPSNAWLDDNPEKAAIIENMPIWGNTHRADDSQLGIGGSTGSAGYWRQHFTVPGSPGYTGRLRNTNITIFDSNTAWTFPYFGYAWSPHESEAPTFANLLGDVEGGMDCRYRWGPDQEEFANKHLFDWLFAQVRQLEGDDTLVSIPAVTPVDGIPYGRPVAAAAGPNAVWTLGNFLPRQVPIITGAGEVLADVNWVINTTAIPPEMYSPAVFVPQTFNVSGTVVLPDNIENPNDVSLEVTIQVTVDGGQKVDVPWTAVRPDIDDGWDNATTIFVGNYIRRTASHPGMPADPFAPTATAEADLLWGDENLYVRVRVTDDNISTVGGNHTVDGAEIFLSEAAFRGAQIGTQAHQMNQYRLSSTGIFTIRWNSAQTGIIGSEAWRRVARDTDIGYDVFMAIPLLYNHGPVDGTTMLFDIMLNDATLPATTRTAEISWNDPSWGGFSNSHGWGEINLVRDGDERPSIVATSGHNGSISPATLSGRLWLDYGANQTFTFTPAFGFVVDTVLVNGEPVTVTGNTFTFTNVTEDHTIHVTFRPDAASVGIPFIVYNDIFAASGLVPFVYTTAVIIDLGEGNSANLADISEEMFIVSATNTRLDGTTVVFDGERRITRAYVNTEPVPLGYIDPAPGSPDLVTDTPAAGRYIILELAFFGPDGPILDARADDGPNSTMLNYRINVVQNLTYQVGGATQSVIPRFEQERVVAPALDRFVPDRTNPDGPGDVRILIAIHEAYQEVGPLPLFVYHHGGGRGGPAGEADRFAPLMTLSGAAVLSKMQLEHPGRFDAHLIATQGHANNEANRQAFIDYVQGLVDAGKVDPNRIYMSGFSLGSGNTFGFLVNNPEFLAAVIPIGGGTMPTQAQIDANPGILDVAIWGQMHRRDGGGTAWYNYFTTGIGSTDVFREINVSIFDSHTIPVFPFFGWAEGAAHETEGAAFAQHIGTKDLYFALGAHEAYADLYIFDWLFNQSRQEYREEILLRIPAVASVDGIPYGRPVAAAAGPNAVWTLGNFLPSQVPIVTTGGRIMADVNWVINTTAIPPEMYSPAVFVPQTFNVSGTVVLPDGVENANDVSLEVTIQVTVDGGRKVDIPWTAVRPDIDDGWDNATTIFVGNYIRRTASHPGMPDDPFAPTATAEADLLWGDENLYVRVRVTDDNISTVGGNHTVDGAEIFLSEAAFRGAQIGTQAHQMNQYRLSSTGIFTIRWNSAQTGIIGSEAWRRVARDTDIGYDVFMAIPLLYNHGPVDGTTMLFDIMLNDATLPATTRTAEISWNDPSWGGFSNSHGWGEITLVRDGDERPSIVATSGHNGSISPATLSGRLWLDYGADQTFTFTPAFGFVVDTVLVNGAPVTVTGNTFTFTNVTEDQTIHVTFRPDAASVGIPFIVHNDIFAASGLVPFVYTTAVIIDLGEGNSVNLADISEEMFIVSATNTRLDGTTVVFDGERKITRAYVNTEPVLLGYIDPAPGSPDLVTDTPAAGRYIILELAFFGPDGPILDARADDGPNSTMLNYRINVVRNLTYQVGGATQSVIPRFEQEQVVAPALDRFVPDRTNPDGPGDMRILIAINEAYQEVGPLPLFVYHHGGGRGGPAGEADRFAPLMTLSGAAVLSKLQLEHPGRFDAHLIATQAHANNQANRDAFIAYVQGLVEAGKVDPNRIYMSGFSAGSGTTFGFLVNNPEFLAAIIPIGGGTMPTQAQIDNNPDILDVAIWGQMHRRDGGGTAWYNYFTTGIGSTGVFREINVSIFATHTIPVFPFFGWAEGAAHETEGAAFAQHIGTKDLYFALGAHEAYADLYIFDWLFNQARECADCGERDCICAGNNVPFTNAAPTIAYEAAWENALVLELNLPAQTSLSAMHPAGVPAATAKAELLWDFENLYVRIHVEDATPFTASGQHTLDSVEFFLAEDNERGPQGQGWRNQYRIARSGAYSFHTATPTTALIGLNEQRRVVQANDEGYTILLAIPLLRNGGPVNMQQMLFDIMINDANAVPQTFPADHVPEVLRGETHLARTRTAQVSWHDIPGLLGPAYGGHMGFQNSHGWGEIRLVGAPAMYYVTSTANVGGSVTPGLEVAAASLAGKNWVAANDSLSFNITPAIGYRVDTVLVNGVPAEPAVPATGGVVTFPAVTNNDNTLDVTFVQAAGARELDFIVFNDVFADGEYTTAVIIDLGAGNSIQTAQLNPNMFTVSARNTTLSGAVERFVGTRNITRVYANDVPEPIGYLSPPGGTPGTPPASGRYIVIELQFFSPAGGYAYGGQTRSGSNTMALNYSIIANAPIGELSSVVFRQDRVVSPVLDRFVRGTGPQNHSIVLDPAWEGDGPENRNPLPVFVYHHGGGRAGAALTHPDGCIFAPLRSANGGAMLSRLQLMDPERFGGVHIIVTHGHNAPNTIALLRELIEAEKVDPNRIYMSGFSAGASTTVNVLRQAPELLAAIVPVGSAERVNQAQVDARPEILDVPVWYIVHLADRGPGGSGSFADNRIRQINTVFDTITYEGRGFANANLTTLVSNGVIGWPYFGFDFTAHESETAAFGNLLGEMIAHCDIFPATGGRRGPDQEAFADLTIFDWMFAQSREQIEEPELTLTFHLYTANQMILDTFGGYATDEVDGIPVIVVPVVPGTPASTWEGFELLSNLGHIYGTAEQKGYAFWGWFDDEMLDYSGRTRDGLRRPTLVQWGEVTCPLADLLAQIEDATMDELLVLFGDGNIDLYGLWVRFGDVDDSSLVNMLDLNLLQRFSNFGHLLPIVFSQAAADVVVDGELNMMDLSLLQRYTNFSHIINVVLGERPY